MKKLKTEARLDGTSVYTTVDGDMLDHVAFEFYGTHVDTTELLYDANPALSQMPLVLPAGITIILPAAPAPRPDTGRVKLWD